MKNFNSIYITVIIFMLFGCKSPNEKKKIEKVETSRTENINNYKKIIDSINQSLAWIKTSFGLYKSKNGDLALKAAEGTEEGIIIEKYITEMADGQPLKSVIDSATFSYLGSSFYKDKNHVYTHYVMVDGGNFWIVDNADVKTFQVLGNCYAKDKNKIFTERNMETDTIFDYRSFKTCDDCGCFAKDKNGYYFWDEKIDINNIENKETESIINRLKKL
ncbi:DKNYY domain-containing protein [Soonwooa sp.]|uniref:DKNYY domain-containing protein n=1 Tax=Soonwooa sp. TaxID=1938592 RepID=UPI0028AA8DB9|nr:DKNYY domain-containing protein [Soonwooa sp.]